MMGDIGEIRTLLYVVSFLSTFFILATLIPPQLLIYSVKNTYLAPTFYDNSEVLFYSYVQNVTIGIDMPQVELELGGWNIAITSYSFPSPMICIETFDRWGPFKYNYNAFRWIDKNGKEASKKWDSRIWMEIYKFDEYERKDLKFTLKNELTQITVYVYYSYDSALKSYENNQLTIILALGFDQRNTSINAFNLVGQLLFFQMPEVHPLINALIAIPLWACISYLVYVLILKAIPFVGG